MPMILQQVNMSNSSQEVGRRTYENKVTAKSTKYATLASNGRAALSECMMV
jgi:hypothetical protein